MRKARIRTKLSIAYIAIVVILVLLSVTAFISYSKKQAYSNAISNMIQISESTMEQIDASLKSMDRVIGSILTTNEFTEDWNSYCKTMNPSDQKRLEKIMIEAYKDETAVRRVAIYNQEGVFLCSGVPEVNQKQVKERWRKIRDYYLNTERDTRILLDPESDFWDPSTNVVVFTEIKPFKDASGNILGFIEVQQNSMYISQICNLKWNGEILNTYIFTGDEDRLLFEHAKDGSDSKTKINEIKRITKQFTKVSQTKTQLITMSNSNDFNCRLVLALSFQTLYKNIRSNVVLLIGLAVSLVAVTIVFIILVVRRITKPVHDFTEQMQNMALENISECHMSGDMDWETNVLSHTFNDMIERLKDALEEKQRMNDLQARTLFSILQAEIKPHFLYNTLGSIANMCDAGENEKASDACYSLSEIPRYTSDYATVEVTLKEELLHLEAYLRIMKNRYKSRLEYEIEADEELDMALLPKLTLQPIVENAIKYSLMENETVRIRILIVRFHQYIIIEIKDNGCGISQQDMKKIQKRIEDYHKQNAGQYILDNIQIGGMGLSGTLIRLQIFFGNHFTYEIQKSNDEGGTSIALKIKIET